MVHRISGIVDVNMYHSLLDPDFTIGRDGEVDDKEWDRFDAAKYTAFVCELAVLELKKLLDKLPADKRCVYVDGSAYIHSNYMHNILDRLYFQVRAVGHICITEAQVQAYLSDFFTGDWNAEFGAAYRISEYISSNCGIGDFPLEEETTLCTL